MTGTNGVEVNGTLVKPPAEVELTDGDLFEMRKKRFVVVFPPAAEAGVRPLPFLLSRSLREVSASQD